MIILLIRMAEIGMIPLIILSILIPGTAITNSNNDNILNAEAKSWLILIQYSSSYGKPVLTVCRG
jgi:hypothetical protein